MFLICCAVLVTFFNLSYALNTRGNNFPIGFQPDEWSKIEQIQSGGDDRNFNHPLLMLEVVQFIFNHYESTPNQLSGIDISQLGRNMSGVYGAVAVCAVSLIGLQMGGLLAMILAGAIALLCPQLIVNAHYFKEDAALVMGFALVALASRLVCGVKDAWWSIPASLFLGIACAVTASAKYAGVTAAPVGLVIILLARGNWYIRLMRLVVFVPILLAATLAINYRALDVREDNQQQMHHFRDKLDEEFEHVTTSHGSVSMDLPNSFSLRVIQRQTDKHLLVLAAASIVWSIVFRRKAWNFLVLLLPITYTAAISFYNVLPFARYSLPSIFLLHVIAGAFVIDVLWRHIKNARIRDLTCVGLTGLIVLLQLPRSLAFSNAFLHDSRLELRKWLSANVPPNTLVGADNYAGLHLMRQGRTPDVPRTTVSIMGTGMFLPQSSSAPRDLAFSGASYAIVCELSYGRFFDPSTHGPADSPDSYNHMRSWYKDLFDHYELVWSYTPKYPTEAMTDPEIKVYKLAAQQRPRGRFRP